MEKGVIRIVTMTDLLLPLGIISLPAVLVVYVLYRMNRYEKLCQGLVFYPDYLETVKDKVRVNYNKIERVTLKSIFITKKGWEPRVVIEYHYDSQLKEIILPPRFQHGRSSIFQFFEDAYVSTETLFKLRRYLPLKIDPVFNRYLNKEEIRFEDLEPIKRMVGVVLMKPSGSFRILD